MQTGWKHVGLAIFKRAHRSHRTIATRSRDPVVCGLAIHLYLQAQTSLVPVSAPLTTWCRIWDGYEEKDASLTTLRFDAHIPGNGDQQSP